MVDPPILVGTELDRASGATHCGFVDMMDSRYGVRGWAVDLIDPRAPVMLELCIGDQVVAETRADTERADISAKLGGPSVSGFQFDAEAMLALPDFLDDPNDVLSVRIAVSGHHLSSAERPPSAGEILARLAAETPPAVADQAGDLELMLDELQAGAAVLCEQALRPLAENLQGYIETIAIDPSGQVWFMGWMKRGHLQEFSAVVVERRKYASAVAVMSYRRDDLPADACGVVGLISSQWRPSSAARDVHLFFGGNGRFHLRSHDPLRILPTAELVAEYEGIRDRCLGDGRSGTLERMLTALENWIPTRAAGQWHATETSIDRILLVPGLGCFVEGWVLSPIKRVEALRLRVGGAVMIAHPDSLYWKQRPDLLSAYPGSGHMIDKAGFVGLFSGEAEPDAFADPVLKVIFEGGGSANWSIAPHVFRRLGHSASVEDALLFFPALLDEAFFPAFAVAAIRAERGATRAPVPITVAASRRCMVFVLPEDRCDIFMLFEEIAQHCRAGGSIDALAFVAAARSNRSDALWLFREFQTTHGVPRGIACSLLVIEDVAQAFGLLPDIVRTLGATRFFFAGHGVFLTELGWARVREALAPGVNTLVFFGLTADPFERRTGGGEVTARCFAWSVGPFARWSLSAPAFMGGFFRDNALRQARSVQIVHPDAARSTRVRTVTRIREAVNAEVYEAAAACQAVA